MTELPGPIQERPLRSLEAELVNLIAGNEHRMRWFTVLGAGAAAAILTLYVPAAYALGWWLALGSLVMVRTHILARLGEDSRTDAQKLALVTRLLALTACAQSAVMAFVPFVPTGVAALLTIYLTGMCGGKLASTAGYRPVVISYTTICMSAIACAWAFSPDPSRSTFDRVVFALMVAAYARVLFVFASGAEQVFADSYRIRLERVGLSEALAAALRNAEAASRAKTRFLASASHDLRQPIHALSLFSGSMMLRPLDERSAAIAGQIDKTVKVLGSQLDALLDVSRLDAGVVTPVIEAIDLSAVLSQIGDQFAAQAERKGLALSVTCATGLWVRTDAVLLRRVLGNLISNSIKFTCEGGVEVGVRQAADTVSLRVRDSGPGIPAAERERVFEEFYQLGNPERDRVKGLGLGLAISRRLSDLLQLDLRMESEEGRGTEFTIVLPITQAPAPAPAAEEEPARSPGVNVLVVEDEEDVRVGMCTLLEEMGFGVRVTASTEDAVSCSARFAPSIVLADFRLIGDDSGIRAVRALRERWPRLPALLISGDTDPDRLREAEAEGIELLHKPLAAPELRDSILRAISA